MSTNAMTAAHRITPQERTVLAASIPLAALLSLAGLDRLPLELRIHPARDQVLKRMTLDRLRAGEFCIVHH